MIFRKSFRRSQPRLTISEDASQGPRRDDAGRAPGLPAARRRRAEPVPRLARDPGPRDRDAKPAGPRGPLSRAAGAKPRRPRRPAGGGDRGSARRPLRAFRLFDGGRAGAAAGRAAGAARPAGTRGAVRARVRAARPAERGGRRPPWARLARLLGGDRADRRHARGGDRERRDAGAVRARPARRLPAVRDLSPCGPRLSARLSGACVPGRGGPPRRRAGRGRLGPSTAAARPGSAGRPADTCSTLPPSPRSGRGSPRSGRRARRGERPATEPRSGARRAEARRTGDRRAGD